MYMVMSGDEAVPYLGGEIFDKIYKTVEDYRKEKLFEALIVNPHFTEAGYLRDFVPFPFWAYYVGILFSKFVGSPTGAPINRNHGFNHVCASPCGTAPPHLVALRSFAPLRSSAPLRTTTTATTTS
jgi:hypothetical protein